MKEAQYLKGIRDALMAVRSAKVGILGTPSSQDTQVIINIVTDTVARMFKVSLELTPNDLPTKIN